MDTGEEKLLLVSILSFFPIINDKTYGAQNPAYRIAHENCVNGIVVPAADNDPGNTKKTGSAQCDEHWNKNISDAFSRSGKYFGKCIENVKGCDQHQHIGTDSYNILIRSKELEQRHTEEHQKSDDRSRNYELHGKTCTDTFVNPVKFACTVILSNESCDGNTECTADHPVNGIQFSIG